MSYENRDRGGGRGGGRGGYGNRGGGRSYGGGGRSYGGGGYQRREMHDAVCAACGTETKVPFKPSGDRPVYCRDCYTRKRDSNLTDEQMVATKKAEVPAEAAEETAEEVAEEETAEETVEEETAEEEVDEK